MAGYCILCGQSSGCESLAPTPMLHAVRRDCLGSEGDAQSLVLLPAHFCMQAQSRGRRELRGSAGTGQVELLVPVTTLGRWIANVQVWGGVELRRGEEEGQLGSYAIQYAKKRLEYNIRHTAADPAADCDGIGCRWCKGESFV